MKTFAPINPPDLVHYICEDALKEELPIKSRFVRRLTPVSRTGKATVKGIEEVAKEVTGPSFGPLGSRAKQVR